MPKIFNKILCPVAFDRNSVAALRFAHELADPDKSTLYLLHVVSAPTMDPIMLEPNPILSEGIAERELEKLVQQHLTSSASCRMVVGGFEMKSPKFWCAFRIIPTIIVVAIMGWAWSKGYHHVNCRVCVSRLTPSRIETLITELGHADRGIFEDIAIFHPPPNKSVACFIRDSFQVGQRNEYGRDWTSFSWPEYCQNFLPLRQRIKISVFLGGASCTVHAII
jgi:Universal stress protein family